MKKSTITIIVLAVVVVLLIVLIWWGIKKGSKITHAKIISAKTGLSFTNYMKLEHAYVKARATAIKNNAPSFTYKGENFNTDTGKKII